MVPRLLLEGHALRLQASPLRWAHFRPRLARGAWGSHGDTGVAKGLSRKPIPLLLSNGQVSLGILLGGLWPTDSAGSA